MSAVASPAPAAPGPVEWFEFSAANGRPPFAADSPPCWAYSGWLRFLVLQAEDLDMQAAAMGPPRPGAMLPRWHYVFDSISNGHVLDRPLPQTDFSGAHQAGEKTAQILMQWCELLDGRRNLWERLRLVLEFLAWGFGVVGEAPKIAHDEALRLYAGVDGRRGVNSRALLDLYQNPCDLFGYVLSQSRGKGWNPNAFFPTPESVVQCMVEMAMHDTKDVDQRGLTVADPCCGTGRMLIHAGQRAMRLFGQDIDWLMVLATKINLAFWCPWGLFQWDDDFFDHVGRHGPPVKAQTGQLVMFGGTITDDVKNKGRKRTEVQRDRWAQTGLFAPPGD